MEENYAVGAGVGGVDPPVDESGVGSAGVIGSGVIGAVGSAGAGGVIGSGAGVSAGGVIGAAGSGSVVGATGGVIGSGVTGAVGSGIGGTGFETGVVPSPAGVEAVGFIGFWLLSSISMYLLLTI